MGLNIPMVKVADYPQLRIIAWNLRPDDEVGEDVAFALYERNWRLVDQAAMDTVERAFVERLTRHYGNGVMNV